MSGCVRTETKDITIVASSHNNHIKSTPVILLHGYFKDVTSSHKGFNTFFICSPKHIKTYDIIELQLESP